MQESFLHFIWKNQYFNKTNLVTTSGEKLNIISQGYLNSDAGPDFSAAQIEIDHIRWAGNIEIHVKSSYWEQHGHQSDEAYENVVLHVVFEHDEAVFRKDGSEIPVLELKNRIDPQLLQASNKLVNSPGQIPCAEQWDSVADITKLAMFDRTLMERLERKSLDVMQVYEKTNRDWEETAYRLLCSNFGFKTNQQPFAQLASVLPLKILRKHANSSIQLEALLFGQAGFLDKLETNYQQELEYEYRFLAHKYQLESSKLHVSQWKFAKLRPANFPTLRLAQLAIILRAASNLFSSLMGIANFKDAQELLSKELSGFWKTHYRFTEEEQDDAPGLGKASIENIIINTIAPLLVAYGKSIDKQEVVDRAVDLLESTKGETNKITRIWKSIGVTCKTASDSQAQIELYNKYCIRKRCLQCAIGNAILKPKTTLVK